MTDQVEVARELLASASKVTVLTGAGISTESGIPDYRGPKGIWTRNPEAERMATIDVWMSEPDVRRQRWQRFADGGAMRDVEPNDGHRALVELERAGKLHTLVTQNVDGLHQDAGTPPDKVVEVHGTLREVICMSCGDRIPMSDALDRVRGGETDLRCLAGDGQPCGGILKSATISFGQQLVPEVLERAQAAAAACDLFLAVGTSLAVYPVAYLPAIAKQSGADLVIVNAEPTPFDAEADAVLHARIGEVLPGLVAAAT